MKNYKINRLLKAQELLQDMADRLQNQANEYEELYEEHREKISDDEPQKVMHLRGVLSQINYWQNEVDSLRVALNLISDKISELESNESNIESNTCCCPYVLEMMKKRK